MFKFGAERLPSVIRERRATRLVLLTITILALVCSPALHFWSADRQPEAQYGSNRRRSRTRITLCTQVLNEVQLVPGLPLLEDSRPPKTHNRQPWRTRHGISTLFLPTHLTTCIMAGRQVAKICSNPQHWHFGFLVLVLSSPRMWHSVGGKTTCRQVLLDHAVRPPRVVLSLQVPYLVEWVVFYQMQGACWQASSAHRG